MTADLDPPPAVLASLAARLAPAELDRARRFRAEADRRRSVAARGWLRSILGLCLGLPPAAVPIEEAAGGKPAVVGGPTLHFNLSHAGDVAVVAVSGRAVGVDVERLDAAEDCQELVPTVCTAREALRLRALAPGDRRVGFLGYWTAKEAYLKGLGVGLALEPRRVEVEWLGDGRAAVGHGAAAGPGWRVVMVPGPAGHVVAVAAPGDDWSAVTATTAGLGL